MIAKALDAISPHDIQDLLDNAVAEKKTLEYKRDLPGNSDEQRREFLADISSFANTTGGDVIFGISEQGGTPEAIVGIGTIDQDLEILRLDGVIASGLSPRIRHHIRIIQINQVFVLLLRIDKSWNPPHRVIFRGHDKFYGRTSAGKYALDVAQLRDAFLENSTIQDRLRDFRINRILEIMHNQSPVPLVEGSKLVVHLLPFTAFSVNLKVNLNPLFNRVDLLRPIGSNLSNPRYTFEGILSYTPHDGPCRTYIHVYRNGVIEFVEGSILNYPHRDGTKNIPSLGYEERVRDGVLRGIRIFDFLGIGTPAAVAVTLTNVKGARLGTREMDFRDPHPVTQENLLLPEAIIYDLGVSVDPILKSIFDFVWNACGLAESENFDAAGTWRPQR
jgi:Putative DNA-binding domain